MSNFVKHSFDYSMKNIPIPSKDSYLKRLIHQTETFITNLRWRVLFFLRENGDESSDSDSDHSTDINPTKETYGFKSSNAPPPIKEIAYFEQQLWNLVDSVQFNDHKNHFQKKLSNDINKITKMRNVLVPADKTRNWYETKTEVYNKLVDDNVTKFYKKARTNAVSTINLEAKKIATSLDLEDRINIIP